MLINRTKLIDISGVKHIDVYDYHIKECKKKKEPLIIEVGSERMYIPPEGLSSYKQITNQKFKSKFGGKNYKLLTFKWLPSSSEEDMKRFSEQCL
jgi:hypothetical protein